MTHAGSEEREGDLKAARTERTTSSDAQDLRRRAMELYRGRIAGTGATAAKDPSALADELGIHQAELEVQNEELRRVQVDLAAARDRYRNLFEYAPVGYLIVDNRGLVRQANLAVELLCGRERADFVGERVEKLFASADRDSCYLLLQRAAASREHHSAELRLTDAGGRDVWVGAVVLSLPRNAGQEGGYQMALTDITARKRAEEAVRQLNGQLEARIIERTGELEQSVRALRAEVEQRRAAEQALTVAGEQLQKRETEIRNLAGELLLVEQRERRRLATVLHDNLQQVLVSAKFRLAAQGRAGSREFQAGVGEVQQMLDECITISRSLAGELSPPVLHDGSFEQALEWLDGQMENRHGLAVKLVSGEGLPSLNEDVKVLLFESVQELLFNTVKHAGVSAVEVDLRRSSESALQITVSDAGKGFEPEKGQAAGASGGGLGLFRIREGLARLGGRMEIESAPGRGSRFRLSVPLAAAIASAAAVPAHATPAGTEPTAQVTSRKPSSPVRVLLADDHAVTREGLARLLAAEADIEIVGEAADGREAVDLACRLLPNVILMDMSMPELTGIEATRIIREECPLIRIIGLSMFDEAEQGRAMRDAGAVAYLSKSGPSSDVIAAIRACMAPAPPES